MEMQFLTDQGLIRSQNEDYGGIFYNTNGQVLSVVADGMGGHKAGDVASKMAVSLLKDIWEKSNEFTSPDKVEQWLSGAIISLNESIYRFAMDKEAYEGMGTTAVITVIAKDFFTVAHIGDSRCYLLNENGFNQITEDHSLVNELVRTGQITKGDAGHHPRKNIVLKALGTEQHVEADIRTLGWERGNKLLLCSDGLTDKVIDDDLRELMESDINIKKIGQKMINLANEYGGEDNISLIIINHKQTEKEGDPSC